MNVKSIAPRDVLFEFHLKFWNTASIGIPATSLLYRLLTGLTSQQKGTTARWYSNKTSLVSFSLHMKENKASLLVCLRLDFR